ELLNNPPGDYWGLIKLNDLYLTDFRRLEHSFYQLMETCFDKSYDNNAKGQAFERACRKQLIEKGLNVIEGSVDVFEPIIPSQICLSLWGKVKKRTDIDVIASIDNKVLVIECKESKWRLPNVSEQNLFKKFLVEHFYRTQWISRNVNKFQEYVGQEAWLSLRLGNKQPLYFIPLLICNNIIEFDQSSKMPLISFLELKDMVSKNIVIKANNQGVEAIGSAYKREISFPCFIGNAV
ncbi:MAG: hypothetical protein M1167_03240, partial [Chloroflexi bacterium]|nr:hypothetical protein [Chloroflexota bacterium]